MTKKFGEIMRDAKIKLILNQDTFQQLQKLFSKELIPYFILI